MQTGREIATLGMEALESSVEGCQGGEENLP